MAINAVGETVRQGKEISTGSGTLDSAGELAVTTPYATIDSVQAMINKGTAPTTTTLSYSVSGSTVTIHGWKATATDDTALIASDAGEDVSYTIIGRRRS